jgi:septal ring factor EnvC (AmiA/AmiB activator)
LTYPNAIQRLNRHTHWGWKTILFLCLLLPLSLHAQERKQLEAKRKQLIKEIDLTTDMLQETKRTREATLTRYLTLQNQIKKRQQLIETLESEVELTNASIDQAGIIIEALEKDIQRLKEEYSQILRAAYRQRLTHSSLLFLFSARSFNDAFRRWRYLQQYDEYRKKQSKLILETQQNLSVRLQWLESRRTEKEALLAKAREQSVLLSQELSDKDQLLQTLKGDEKRLSSELREKEKAHEELNSAIERIIREEMAKARRRGRADNTDEATPATPEEIKLAEAANQFGANKGKLPWPVEKGVVTGYFGKQEHPTLAGVEITNNGIDIRTDQGAKVRAVHPGRVVGVQFIPTHDYMVLIQHGTFYTVYSNLATVDVKRGDSVARLETLGTVRTNKKTNTTEVHFEVWKEKNRMNPLQWVRKI